MDALEVCRGLDAELTKRGLVGLDFSPKAPALDTRAAAGLPPPFKVVIASPVGYFCLRRWGIATSQAVLAPLLFLLESIHDFSHLKFADEAIDRFELFLFLEHFNITSNSPPSCRAWQVIAACDSVVSLWSGVRTTWPQSAPTLAAVGFDQQAQITALDRLTIAATAVRTAVVAVPSNNAASLLGGSCFTPMAMALGQLLHRSFNSFVASPDHWPRYQALSAAASSSPAVNHRSFEVKGRLGTGGYSVVYAAVKRDTGHLYAMKCIDKRLIHSRGVSRLLLSERDVLGLVDSPFVASLRYAFHSASEVCLVSGELKGVFSTVGAFRHLTLYAAYAGSSSNML
jgi:hypothetical protein